MDKDQGLVLSTESKSASETHILDVNLDCLHEIFSLQCFSMSDLCSIGESHDRFIEVVDVVFAKRHKNYSVDLGETIDLNETSRILNNFGSWISELSIDGGWTMNKGNAKWEQLLQLVTKYCSSTLDSVQLENLTISEAQTIKLKPIFDKLQKISLCKCKIYSGEALFSNCASLVELKLTYVQFADQRLVLENTFPKLDRFEYHHDTMDSTYLWRDSNKSNDFFSRHPNLKSLTLYTFFGILLLLPGIADNCKQLAELDIEIDEEQLDKALTCIVSLDHLKKLKLYCGDFDGRNITKFVKKLGDSKSLEILCLVNVAGDSEFVPALSKLTKLKELELVCWNELTNLNPLAHLERLTALKITTHSYENLDCDLVRMVKRLIHLKTLKLRCRSFRMDQQMYLRIVEAVRERPGRFQDALKILCHTAEDCSADSFGDADCRKLVRIIKF